MPMQTATRFASWVLGAKTTRNRARTAGPSPISAAASRIEAEIEVVGDERIPDAQPSRRMSQ